jgi:hypothetical protein
LELDQDFFENSVYYPACHFDGTPIKFLGKTFSNFVYSDYLREYGELTEDIRRHGLTGYKLKDRRYIDAQELFGMSWPKYISINSGVTFFKWENPFAIIYLFERDDYLTDDFGKSEIRLLYIKSEGISAYKYLYLRRGLVPKCLVTINPGLSFGGNVQDYPERFSKTIQDSRILPEYQFFDDDLKYFDTSIESYTVIAEYDYPKNINRANTHFCLTKLSAPLPMGIFEEEPNEAIQRYI